VAYAEAEARRRTYAQLRLYTHVLMTENLALYRRLGFEETGRITEKGYERVYIAKRVR
jgi:ribosomal protein S18 acetylase RimI-like enzyme